MLHLAILLEQKDLRFVGGRTRKVLAGFGRLDGCLHGGQLQALMLDDPRCVEDHLLGRKHAGSQKAADQVPADTHLRCGLCQCQPSSRLGIGMQKRFFRTLRENPD